MAIFKSKEPEEESYLEVTENASSDGTIRIRIEKLANFADTDRVQNLVRDGNVIFLSIKELRLKDINELKKSVNKLKKTITANSGDIVGVDEDVLVLTPNVARVFR